MSPPSAQQKPSLAITIHRLYTPTVPRSRRKTAKYVHGKVEKRKSSLSTYDRVDDEDIVDVSVVIVVVGTNHPPPSFIITATRRLPPAATAKGGARPPSASPYRILKSDRAPQKTMPAATPDAQRRRIRRTSGDRRLRRCVGGGRFVNLRRRNDVRRDDDSLPPPHSPLDVGIRRCRLSPKEEHDVVVQYLVVGRGNGRWGEDDEKERRAMCGRPAS